MISSLTQVRAGIVATNRIALPRSSGCAMRARSSFERRHRALLQDRRRHLAGQDRGGADAVHALLHVDRLGERDHGALGGVVRRPGEHARVAARPGGDVDDQAVLPRAHAGQHRVAAVEQAVEVDGDDVVPAFGGHGLEVALRAADVGAGAGDQDVDAAVALLDVGRGGATAFLSETSSSDRLRAAGFFQLRQGLMRWCSPFVPKSRHARRPSPAPCAPARPMPEPPPVIQATFP